MDKIRKIIECLKKCCKEIYQSNKNESDENKTEHEIKEELFKILSKSNGNINKDNIFILSSDDVKTTIKKEKFRQSDGFFSDDEKWYEVYSQEKIDISLLYDNVKNIPCNIIFTNYNIDLYVNKSEYTQKNNTTIFENHLYFYNCTFKKSLNIIDTTFKKTLTFNQCSFKEKTCIYKNKFLNHLVFIDCSVENNKKIKSLDLQENNFEEYLFIKNCDIENMGLWKNKFENRCYFVDSKFGNKEKAKLDFSNAHFQDNVYFNNSHFKDYTDFQECEFEKIACFSGVKFDKAPNFSACYFKEQKAVNLNNVDIDKLDFKSVENYIQDNYQDENFKNEIKIIENEKEKLKTENRDELRCVKNLKDSFRTIKDILITQNNALEAQEWHKLELYAKEKELEVKLGEYKKNNINSKYKIKKINIWNIIDVFMTKFSLVACYVIFYLFLGLFPIQAYRVIKAVIKFIFKIVKILLSCVCYINSIDRILKLEYLKIYRKISCFGRKMLDFTLWFDCVLLQVYRNTSNHHTNFLKILNFTILMISLYAIMVFFFSITMDFISSFNSVGISIVNFIILSVLFIIFSGFKKQLYLYAIILSCAIFGIFTIGITLFLSPVYIPTFYFLVYFMSILIFYFLFICKIKLFVFTLRLFTYTCLVIIIIIKPQLINPFVGIFSLDKLYESKFEKRLNDLNTSDIIILANISQKNFNFWPKDQNISFTELNSAKTLIMINREKLKEILSKIYDDKYKSDYKKVLNELENNVSNVKNTIEEIDNENNNSIVSVQLNQFLKLNFTQEIDHLYAIKRIFPIAKKLSSEQLALFDQREYKDRLKSILLLLNFKSGLEILKTINQDEIMQNTIKSTSVLYSIILLLCIFSLQKTARKNSIVPS